MTGTSGPASEHEISYFQNLLAKIYPPPRYDAEAAKEKKELEEDLRDGRIDLPDFYERIQRLVEKYYPRQQVGGGAR